jgi:DeoR family transcriptional regulator, fructose operon transcriptional repressor
MSSEKRKLLVINRLQEEPEVDIKQLAAELHVSEITVRRDLNELAKDGLLYRTHGGAMRVTEWAGPFTFANKAAVNAKAKEAIARRAASEIADGDILFMDCGSTVFHMCPFIKWKKIQVITNSLPVVSALQVGQAAVNLVGGEVDRNRQAVHGWMAGYHVQQYRATKAFLGVDGISAAGLFAHSEKEATMTLSMAAQSKRRYLLCDAGKLGWEHILRFAGLDLIDAVITDASARDCRFLKKAGVAIIRATVRTSI